MEYKDYTIVEYLRRRQVEAMLDKVENVKGKCIRSDIKQPVNVFEDYWKKAIKDKLSFNDELSDHEKAERVINLGKYLKAVFEKSNVMIKNAGGARGSESQSNLAIAGDLWERICLYYLNLCLAGTNTVVVSRPSSLPRYLQDSITFNLEDRPNEGDLIAINFPNNDFFKASIGEHYETLAKDKSLAFMKTPTGRKKKQTNNLFDLIVDYISNKNYWNADERKSNFGLHIMQLKTNWNDSIQTPMLWSQIYQMNRFIDDKEIPSTIRFGINAHNLSELKRFSYSFVTLPSQKDDANTFSSSSLAVKRGRLIKDGCYWGKETKADIAKSISEIFTTLGISNHDIVSKIEYNLANDYFAKRRQYEYFKLSDILNQQLK